MHLHPLGLDVVLGCIGILSSEKRAHLQRCCRWSECTPRVMGGGTHRQSQREEEPQEPSAGLALQIALQLYKRNTAPPRRNPNTGGPCASEWQPGEFSCDFCGDFLRLDREARQLFRCCCCCCCSHVTARLLASDVRPGGERSLLRVRACRRHRHYHQLKPLADWEARQS